MEVPKIEVRFENLKVEADVQAGTRALPTLVNVSRDFIEVVRLFSLVYFPHVTILRDCFFILYRFCVAACFKQFENDED